jgi:hypothetical protein
MQIQGFEINLRGLLLFKTNKINTLCEDIFIKAHHRVIILWKNGKIMGVTSFIICLVFLMCFYYARLPVQPNIL